jgi:hypothetical protein
VSATPVTSFSSFDEGEARLAARSRVLIPGGIKFFLFYKICACVRVSSNRPVASGGIRWIPLSTVLTISLFLSLDFFIYWSG